jgi:hypothetical protein
MSAKIYDLNARRDRYRVSSEELGKAEAELRALHREQNAIEIAMQERFLMLRALAAISDGHAEPLALASATLETIHSASKG